MLWTKFIKTQGIIVAHSFRIEPFEFSRLALTFPVFYDYHAQSFADHSGWRRTDLASYYRQHGGFLIAAAIDKYVYVTVMRPFVAGIFLKYSQLEHVAQADEVQHPIIREAIRVCWMTANRRLKSLPWRISRLEQVWDRPAALPRRY